MAEGKLIVECYGDNLLIKKLGYDCLEGHSGIGQVANRMREYFENQFALAVIDSDKALGPAYFKKENIKSVTKPAHGVQLYKCAGKFHYVIKISPAFEDFILIAGKQAGYDRGEFKLPVDDKVFRNLCKDKAITTNQNMGRFLHATVTKNPPSIKALRAAIAEAYKNKPK